MTSNLPAVLERDELALPEPKAAAVLDVDYREIAFARSYGGPADRPRSVVLLAGLVAFAICGAPFLVFVLAEVVWP